jgi:hypothetical protein
MFQTNIYTRGTRTQNSYKFRDLPTLCPICFHSVVPVPAGAYGSAPYAKGDPVQVAMQCANGECQKLFISNYKYDLTEAHYEFTGRSAPWGFQRINFDKCITELSPLFGKIYNQAAQAESMDLDQICGMGYRKALEFLIKDFAIHKHPDDKENVKKKFLGPCIRDYIDNPKIVTCANRAAWLGNDESHYERR